MSKIYLAFVSAALVEEDGKLTVELCEDAPALHALPLIGKALPAVETIPVVSIGGVVGAFHGALDGIRGFFGPKK